MMRTGTSHKNPSGISIADFSYELPDHRIAKYPLVERDTSKLLVYRSGEIATQTFRDLSDLLSANDCLVFNDTKVIHARLQFQRETGARIEIFCLEPVEPREVTEAFAAKGKSTWKAMVGNAKRWKDGEVLTRVVSTESGEYNLYASLVYRETDAFHVRFDWDSDFTFSEVLDQIGILPLPPYLNRDTEAEDEERYQTVYAQSDGSVAAPTAGLHFTQAVFDSLKTKEIQTAFVTLHVGAGTFKPVKSETMEGHEMHQERISVSRNAILRLCDSMQNRNRIIPVGTTSLRTIESIYWFGVKLISGIEMKELDVLQWEPYQLANQNLNASDSLKAVLDWMDEKGQSYLNGQTQLLIAPGYEIRMADALITNFHQPQSTLLLLVAALIGPEWKSVYQYALENDFRFLSFGDSSILFRDQPS
jgi:S-adenosylmethionine:tRNA ribosyltransferase-isomerase